VTEVHPAASSLLRMENITKDYGATRALDCVNFNLERGEVHALLGENGAGKSTLIKILSGAIRPDGGTIRLEGAAFCPSGPLDSRRSGISVVYQELTLAPHLTVEENINLGRERHCGGFLHRAEMRQRVRDILGLVHHPEISPEVPVRRLSVGARQIVEIGRALMDQAKILVMDEPTSSLSQEDGRLLFEIIRRLKSQGVGVIYISHFLEEVQQVADRFTVLRDGRNSGSGIMRGATLESIIRMMVGQEVRDMFPKVAHAPGAAVLTMEELKSRSMQAPVSLELRRGEIMGIAGLIGSGRTEMLRGIFGLDRAERGTVTVAGAASGRGVPWLRIKQGVGLLSEDRQGEGLALNLSIADNLTLSHFAPYRRFGFLGNQARRRAADGWIRDMNIKARSAVQPVVSLSGGNQQKVALARLLHQKAEVFLLDEPTRGIDIVSKAQIYQWIGELAGRGKAVLFVSSYFPELLGVCDTIAVFHRGRLVDIRPVAGWNHHSLMTAATTGRAAAAYDSGSTT